MPNWADQLRGSMSYGGKDLSSDPMQARDPRPRSLANNRMMQQPQYLEGEGQPGALTPLTPDPMDQAMKQMDQGQQMPGTMQEGRRMGAQQQPGASKLIQLLRMLGVM